MTEINVVVSIHDASNISAEDLPTLLTLTSRCMKKLSEDLSASTGLRMQYKWKVFPGPTPELLEEQYAARAETPMQMATRTTTYTSPSGYPQSTFSAFDDHQLRTSTTNSIMANPIIALGSNATYSPLNQERSEMNVSTTNLSPMPASEPSSGPTSPPLKWEAPVSPEAYAKSAPKHTQSIPERSRQRSKRETRSRDKTTSPVGRKRSTPYSRPPSRSSSFV